MTKRMDGLHEPILDPEIPIIDAHTHFVDHPELHYMLPDYLDDCKAGHRIVASVYVEVGAFSRKRGPEMLRPLGEIEFANGIGAMCASEHYGPVHACAAIVGHADLRFGAAIGDMLARAKEIAPDRFRGIRQGAMEHPSDIAFRYYKWYFSERPPTGAYRDPMFREGFGQLAPLGLTFDANGFHLQMPDIIALADEFPDTTIILNHMTVAMGVEMDARQTSELFQQWRGALVQAAKRPNIVCKVGGLGMPFWGFGFDERSDAITSLELAQVWKPFVETAIELFGPSRCMLESNYPPDASSCGYVPLWNALKRIVSGYTLEEKSALFYGTAARIYRVDLGDLDMANNPLELSAAAS